MIAQAEQNSPEILACLVLDDPLLKPRYGCLDYVKLLHEMKEHRFFTEIAFIPWNWRRSDPKTIRLFADNPDYYGICVHGCNHTYGEFGGMDYQTLSDLSSTALWRMEQHKRLTGLSYDPVMVFPQGRFSSIAMQALNDQGYHAAFNSILQSTDEVECPVIECKQPAARMYHDFPLFLRRYPRDKKDFLQDIQAGRPLIIVEHHGAFQNGYKKLIDFIDWINEQGNIKWSSLSSIADTFYCSRKNILPAAKCGELKYSIGDRVKVNLRRFACEFRDNYVEPNPLLSSAYQMLRGKK